MAERIFSNSISSKRMDAIIGQRHTYGIQDPTGPSFLPKQPLPPLLERIVLPEIDEEHVRQVARTAAMSPSDLTSVVEVIIAEADVQQKPGPVIMSAQALIDARRNITEGTIHYLEHLNPTVVAVFKEGSMKNEQIIFQAPGLLRATFNHVRSGGDMPPKNQLENILRTDVAIAADGDY